MVLLRSRKQVKTMRNKNFKINLAQHFTRQTALFASIMLVLGTAVSVPIARADNYTDKINQIQADNSQKKNQIKVLQVNANSLQATIDAIQQQINESQSQIDANTAKSNDLQTQIVAAQAELDQQKKILGENIKSMYLEGDISTIEMLATSKDLSAYFDKQQYRNTVKNKITDTLARVTSLKAQLKDQQTQLADLIKQETELQNQQTQQRAEQARILGQNQSDQAALDTQIRANASALAQLEAARAAALAAVMGSNGQSATGSPVKYKNYTGGMSCGGGYSYCWTYYNQYLTETLNTWGLEWSRQCVHYVADYLTREGKNVPNLAGRGNANQWPQNAKNHPDGSYGSITSNPQHGDVVYMPLAYPGHVGIVEHVNDDGTIHVSQMNWPIGGYYSELDLYVTSGVEFIHFN
ncbi:MAG: exported protein of unknown function [Candidatus Saccharibacteria bacterium]|nr:exported protein of unknown function [Candidatus Saccharibacteria bacterium]